MTDGSDLRRNQSKRAALATRLPRSVMSGISLFAAMSATRLEAFVMTKQAFKPERRCASTRDSAMSCAPPNGSPGTTWTMSYLSDAFMNHLDCAQKAFTPSVHVVGLGLR